MRFSYQLSLTIQSLKAECLLLGDPVCMGGLGFTDPVVTSSSEYEASINVTNPLVRRIVEQEQQPPDAP